MNRLHVVSTFFSLVLIITVSMTSSTFGETLMVDPESENGHHFGFSVDVSSDKVIVGAQQSRGTSGISYTGIVYVFDTNGNLQLILENPLQGEGDFMGRSVAISGNLVVSGIPQTLSENLQPGKVILHDITTCDLLDGTTDSICKTANVIIDNPISENEYAFGNAVDISGDKIIVGSFNANIVGEAYVFDSLGNLLLTLIHPSDGIFYGESVAIEGDIALVGAGQSGNHLDGEVYMYNISNCDINDGIVDGICSSPNLTLENPNKVDMCGNCGRFGNSVSISNDLLLIGARNDDTTASNSGQAYLFDYTTCDALDGILDDRCSIPDITYASPTNEINENYGFSVDISDTNIIIGTHNADTVYRYSTSSNQLQETFANPSTSQISGEFGTAVAINQNNVVIGARNIDEAYLYTIDGNTSISINAPLDGSRIQNVNTISGTVEENSSVIITIDGGLTFPATVTGTSWTVDGPPLLDGIHIIEATATDSSGNIAMDSITITTDTTGPIIDIDFLEHNSITNTLTASGTATDYCVASVEYGINVDDETDFLPAIGTYDWSFSLQGTESVHIFSNGYYSATSYASGGSGGGNTGNGAAAYIVPSASPGTYFPPSVSSSGEYIVTMRATDCLGNVSTFTSNYSLFSGVAVFESNVRIGENFIHASFGNSIAMGDLDNDGFDDLIGYTDRFQSLHNPDKSISPFIGIYFGSPDVFKNTFADSSPDRIINLPYDGVVGGGAEKMSVGDINNDGIDDLIIGLKELEVSGNYGAGQIWIFYGGQDDFDTNVDLQISNPAPVLSAEFGQSFATGDIDGDGLEDLVAICPNCSTEKAFIYHGNSVIFGSNPQVITSDEPFQKIKIGKLDNDSFDDVLIGIPLAGIGNGPNLSCVQFQPCVNGAGKVLAYTGGAIFDTTPDFVLTSNNIIQSERFGGSIELGDINNDNFNDLVIGSTGINQDNLRGKLYLYFGSPIFDNVIDLEFTPNPSLNSDGYSHQIEIEDIHNDGFEDLIIVDAHRGGVQVNGYVEIHKGDTNFDTNVDSRILSRTNLSIAGSMYGTNLAQGDMNRDERKDIAISEESFTFGFVNGQPSYVGRVFVNSCVGLSSVLDSDLDGIPNDCDADNDNDGIFDTVDIQPLDNSNNSFNDGNTSGIIDRADRTIQIFDIYDESDTIINEGVRIKIGPGSVDAQVTGLGTCITEPPTNINVIDANGADFIISCSSTAIQVNSGTVQMSSKNQDIEIKALLNSNQTISFENDQNGNLVINNLSDSKSIIVSINNQDTLINQDESYVVKIQESQKSVPMWILVGIIAIIGISIIIVFTYFKKLKTN